MTDSIAEGGAGYGGEGGGGGASDDELRPLLRLLERARGFALAFASRRDPAALATLARDLTSARSGHRTVRRLELTKPEPHLLDAVRALAPPLGAGEVLLLAGYEHSLLGAGPHPPALGRLNLEREAWRPHVPCPVVFLLPEEAVTLLARGAPDFWAWRSEVVASPRRPHERGDLRLFVVAPDDVRRERRRLGDFVHRLGDTIVAPEGLHLELLHWESETLPPEPASLLDDEVAGADLVIAVLWHRFADTLAGRAADPAALAARLRRWHAASRPALLAFLSRRPLDPAELDPDELARLAILRPVLAETATCHDSTRSRASPAAPRRRSPWPCARSSTGASRRRRRPPPRAGPIAAASPSPATSATA